jgi:hypothetical protein
MIFVLIAALYLVAIVARRWPRVWPREKRQRSAPIPQHGVHAMISLARVMPASGERSCAIEHSVGTKPTVTCVAG